MSGRPKRKSSKKIETPIKMPRRWKDDEMETLLNCLMQYGHKNLEKLQEHLPGRNVENIKAFMRTVHDTAIRMTKKKDVLDFWIDHCDALGSAPWQDCIQIAQVLKYLSVDGLLENHPLPERCQGIDFRQAYRLLYQAMMGYPIQPVNQPTADFVVEAVAELNGEIKKQTDAIKQVESFLKNPTKPESLVKSENLHNETSESFKAKKPLRVYTRKKPTSAKPEAAPSVKIIIEENPCSEGSNTGCLRDFSITVKEKDSVQSSTINVPVPCKKAVDKDEEELLKSSSYNPFQIPMKWLEEPLYLNLVQKL